MTITFTQTDTATVCSAATYCSAKSLNTTQTSLRQATVGGTAGVTEVLLTIDASASILIALFFECIVGSNVSWDAGTWTVNLNVTTFNKDITWTGIDICRVDSSCVNQASIGSGNAGNQSFTVTGVYTATVSGSAQTPAAGDKVMVLLEFSNGKTSTMTFGYTPNQTIVSPFSSSIISPNSLMLVGVGT